MQLELDREPISSVIEIDGEFIWLITEAVFKTSLLPKWQHMDCLNETEEFQFILQTLEQIFELDLSAVNAAYLTMRKPEFVYLVLNALTLANDYVRSTKNEEDPNGLTDQSSESGGCSGHEVSSIVSSDLSNLLSIDSSDDSSNSSGSYSGENKKETIKENGRVKEVESKDENGAKKSETSSSLLSTEEDSLKVSKKLPKENFQKKLNLPAKSKKEFTDDELANKLKELKDGKKLIQSLSHQKEQNFALQISFKILEVLKIQERTKKIKSNLNRMHAYGPHLDEQSPGLWQSFRSSQSFHSRAAARPKTGQTKRATATLKKKRQSAKKAPVKRPKSLDLNEIVNKLTGLSGSQLSELKDKRDQQKQLVNRVKCDLVEVERRLQSEMITKIEKENRLLEILQKDLNLDLNLSSVAKNRLERKQLMHAKCELRKERVDLKRFTDELHQSNLSNLKHLQAEQDRQLRELARNREQALRQQVQQVKKQIRECETKMREDQKRLLEDYDNFYLSQSTLIRQEIARQTSETKATRGDSMQFNSVSLTRHLQQSYISKLYPKFD